VRRIDFCITQLKAQGPSRTFNESKEEKEKEKEEKGRAGFSSRTGGGPFVSSASSSLLLSSLELNDTQVYEP